VLQYGDYSIPIVHVPFSGGGQVLQNGDYQVQSTVRTRTGILRGLSTVKCCIRETTVSQYKYWPTLHSTMADSRLKGSAVLCYLLRCTPVILVFQSIPPQYFQGTADIRPVPGQAKFQQVCILEIDDAPVLRVIVHHK
jgi:hypothetical protein